MSKANLGLQGLERVQAEIKLGESHFREFKSAQHGAPGKKIARKITDVMTEIGDTLVAFANADGGTLLVGVEDDGAISGILHSEADQRQMLNAPVSHVHAETPLPPPLQFSLDIEGKRVLGFVVSKGTRLVHLTSDGRCIQRRDRETVPVSSEQIKFERQDQLSREFDRQFVDGADISALNLEFLEKVRDVLARGMSLEKCLQLLDLADFDNGRIRLKRGALLLFSKAVSKWHPRCEIRIFRVNGTSVKSGHDYNVATDESVSGCIFELILKGWEALRPHLVRTQFAPGAVFEERMTYPEDACREALTNAIAHRAYNIDGRGIEVFVFDDRMEVRSPGALLTNVTLDSLKRAQGLHQSRNTLIARTLRELGYMREMGEGIKRIYSLMKANDLVEPELVSDLESFTITLRHQSIFSQDAQRWLAAYDRFNLTREEKKIVLMGRSGDALSTQQIWDVLEIVDTDDFRAVVETLRLKGILGDALSSSKLQMLERNKQIEKKAIAKFKIRTPEECERSLAELFLAIRDIGARSALSTIYCAAIQAALPVANPYKKNISLKSLRCLGLIDSLDKPVATIKALWQEKQIAAPSVPAPAKSAGVPSRDLFVANLDKSVTEAALREHFARCGTVQSARIPIDAITGQSRGFGFVQYSSDAEGIAAIQKLSDTELGGKKIDITRARPKNKK